MTSSSIANLKFWQLTAFCPTVVRVKLKYKQDGLEILYDAHSNGTINVKKKKDT